jgi:hypothetical protein
MRGKLGAAGQARPDGETKVENKEHILPVDERTALARAGVRLLVEFCRRNELPEPEVVAMEPACWPHNVCAYYRPTTIRICLPMCAKIGRGGRAWSYPAYIVDRTPYGVLLHELGHHVDVFRSANPNSRRGIGDWSAQVARRMLEANEKPLTSYAPDASEVFAEAFRLFATNPELLRAVRPVAFAALSEKLRPLGDTPWQKVLEGAPERTLLAARNHVDRAVRLR